MLVPAACYKEEIEKKFAELAYTEKLMWYDGCIENYRHELPDGEDRYQFAIVEGGKLFGYVSFRVDWYCSQAFNFGLMSFGGEYYSEQYNKYISGKVVVFKAIREIIRMIESFNLHRIDFRCVGGNPAELNYTGIASMYHRKYFVRKVTFKDNIKDRQGNYHDTLMFEMIKKD